jgi:TrmH family RNA methyltransferase
MSASSLSSKDNPLVRTIRLVMEEARRAPAHLVLAEGVRGLEEATEAGCDFEAILIEEGFGSDPRQQALLDAWSARGAPVRFAKRRLMRELSGVVSPQGALALVRMRSLTLAQAPETAVPLILCLCGLQDPGNLGTLLRTARAVGVSLVCSMSGTVSARNSKAIRASAGAFFRIPIVEKLTPAEFCRFCRDRRIVMFQAHARGRQSCWEADLAGPAAILLGSEARGFTESDWQDAVSVRIPMSAGVESLNVAAAGAVLMFEALRQRAGRAFQGVRP